MKPRQSKPHIGWGAVMTLATCGMSAAFAGPPSTLKVLSDQALPLSAWQTEAGRHTQLRKVAPAYGKHFLLRAADVRWQDDRHVLIASIRDGTLRVAVDPGEHAQLGREFGPLENAGSMGAHAMIGYSPKFIASASVGHIVTWMQASGPEPRPVSVETDFNTLIDLDVFEDRILVLGLQKIEGKKLAADGAIAWTGKLSKVLSEIRPVQFSISGPGARDTDACSPMMMGKVRFLPQGGFVVAPGAEPGVFVHDSAGRLQKTLQAETIGYDAGCPISEDEMMQYSVDDDARFRWMNARRILDEILPLPQGIGFVVRTRANGVTSWSLKALAPDGKITAYALPFTAPSEFARLSGDVRGDRLAFLLFSESDSLPPPGSIHLIIAEVPRPATSAPLAKPSPPKKSAPPKRPPGP